MGKSVVFYLILIITWKVNHFPLATYFQNEKFAYNIKETYHRHVLSEVTRQNRECQTRVLVALLEEANQHEHLTYMLHVI